MNFKEELNTHAVKFHSRVNLGMTDDMALKAKLEVGRFFLEKMKRWKEESAYNACVDEFPEIQVGVEFKRIKIVTLTREMC